MKNLNLSIIGTKYSFVDLCSYENHEVDNNWFPDFVNNKVCPLINVVNGMLNFNELNNLFQFIENSAKQNNHKYFTLLRVKNLTQKYDMKYWLRYDEHDNKIRVVAKTSCDKLPEMQHLTVSSLINENLIKEEIEETLITQFVPVEPKIIRSSIKEVTNNPFFPMTIIPIVLSNITLDSLGQSFVNKLKKAKKALFATQIERQVAVYQDENLIKVVKKDKEQDKDIVAVFRKTGDNAEFLGCMLRKQFELIS